MFGLLRPQKRTLSTEEQHDVGLGDACCCCCALLELCSW